MTLELEQQIADNDFLSLIVKGFKRYNELSYQIEQMKSEIDELSEIHERNQQKLNQGKETIQKLQEQMMGIQEIYKNCGIDLEKLANEDKELAIKLPATKYQMEKEDFSLDISQEEDMIIGIKAHFDPTMRGEVMGYIRDEYGDINQNIFILSVDDDRVEYYGLKDVANKMLAEYGGYMHKSGGEIYIWGMEKCPDIEVVKHDIKTAIYQHQKETLKNNTKNVFKNIYKSNKTKPIQKNKDLLK